jgi:signal transduction histidine kinase
MATLAAAAFTLSAVMGALAYFTTRHFLLSERQSTALRQAYANAALLRSALAADSPNISATVTGLGTGPSSVTVLDDQGVWYSSTLGIGHTTLPASLTTTVSHGDVAVQTTRVLGSPRLFVGVPLPSVNASTYLVTNLSDIEQTLRVLLAALAAAAAATALLGAAVGAAASRRALKPVTDVSTAAVAIAQGELGTRLPVDTADPDLRGLTESFNAMADRLEERILRDARFTSDVSHELRSPLTTLAASLDVLDAHRAELDPRGRQALELMTGDVHRFQRLVADLLEIARSDADVGGLTLDEVDVSELVHNAVAGAVRLAEGAAMPRVEISEDAAHLRLLVDKRRFGRVMGNLIENGQIYAGGVTSVVVAKDEARAGVVITLSDEGPGIAPEERTKIFDRFYRGGVSGRRGSTEGSGLGLAIVDEHVRRHGGSVSVEEGPGGRGTSFVVRLPLDPEPVAP